MGSMALMFASSHGFALDDKTLPFERDNSRPEITLGIGGLNLAVGSERRGLSGFQLGLTLNNFLLSPTLSMKAYYNNSHSREQAIYAYSAGIRPALSRLKWAQLHAYAELGLIDEKTSPEAEASFEGKNTAYGSFGLTLEAHPWRTGESSGIGLFARAGYCQAFSSQDVRGVEYAAGISWQSSNQIPVVAK